MGTGLFVLARKVRRRLAGPPSDLSGVAPAARPSEAVRPIDAQDPLGEGAVDVNDLLARLGMDELSQSADEYYRQNLTGADYYLAKPFWNASEVADMVISFGHVLGLLRLSAGMEVLDFGAGAGWTSRYLSQLGCEVIVCDVSSTALDLARQLYQRSPVVGDRPAPSFMRFDGRSFDIEDESVDRVLCFDALHHVPNPAQVIAEMGRVLKPGGRAVFSEPGPNHSKTPQSQFEMKNYVVIENDILMHDVERWARAAGFADVRLAVLTTQPFEVPIEGYERLLASGEEARQYLEHHREFLESRRVFVLRREGEELRDSRARDGLGGTITVNLDSDEVAPGSVVHGRYEVCNTGTNHWLASSAPLGPVLIGVHLYDSDGRLIDRDYARVDLRGEDGVAPSARAAGPFGLVAPREPGSYVVEFDLVAEGVAWFEINGTVPSRIALSVR